MYIKKLYGYVYGIVLIISMLWQEEAMGFRFSKNGNTKIRLYYEGKVMFHEFVHSCGFSKNEPPCTMKTFVLNDRYKPRGANGNRSQNNIIRFLNGYKGKIWRPCSNELADNRWYKKEVVYEAGAVRFIYSNAGFPVDSLDKFKAILYDSNVELKISNNSIREAFAQVMRNDELSPKIDCSNGDVVRAALANDVDKIIKYNDAMFDYAFHALSKEYPDIEAVNAMIDDAARDLKNLNKPISDFSFYSKAANAPLCEFCEAVYCILVEALNPCSASDTTDMSRVRDYIRNRVELAQKSIYDMLGINIKQLANPGQCSSKSKPKNPSMVSIDGTMVQKSDQISNRRVLNKQNELNLLNRLLPVKSHKSQKSPNKACFNLFGYAVPRLSIDSYDMATKATDEIVLKEDKEENGDERGDWQEEVDKSFQLPEQAVKNIASEEDEDEDEDGLDEWDEYDFDDRKKEADKNSRSLSQMKNIILKDKKDKKKKNKKIKNKWKQEMENEYLDRRRGPKLLKRKHLKKLRAKLRPNNGVGNGKSVRIKDGIKYYQ
jgi:hypothetical protein